MTRGTEVVLHLKEDAESFLEDAKLEEIIKKHSEFINFPIELWAESTIEEESTPDIDEVEAEVEDVTDEVPTPKETTTRIVHDWKLVNENKPIWTKPSSEVTAEEVSTALTSVQWFLQESFQGDQGSTRVYTFQA